MPTVKPYNKHAEKVARLLFGIEGVPATEQKKMVQRAVKYVHEITKPPCDQCIFNAMRKDAAAAKRRLRKYKLLAFFKKGLLAMTLKEIMQQYKAAKKTETVRKANTAARRMFGRLSIRPSSISLAMLEKERRRLQREGVKGQLLLSCPVRAMGMGAEKRVDRIWPISLLCP